MKNTALLIDTNVILNWLLEREPFAEQARQVMEHCINGKAKGYLACHSILNIFYITRKILFWPKPCRSAHGTGRRYILKKRRFFALFLLM